jgi:chorismate mutase
VPEPGRVRAVRGATTIPENSADSIVEGTTELLEELFARNEIEPDDLISIVFTATDDLDAVFPAVAARKLGVSEVPLLCAREIAVPDSIPMCIRVLAHLYTDRNRDGLHHIYLRGARALRTDLHEEYE